MDTKVTQKLVTARSTTPGFEVTKGRRQCYQNLPGRCLTWLRQMPGGWGLQLCLGSSAGGSWQPQSDHGWVGLGMVLSAAAGGMPRRSWTSESTALLDLRKHSPPFLPLTRLPLVPSMGARWQRSLRNRVCRVSVSAS